MVYADLLDTGKKRCIEIAQKLYEEHIKNTLFTGLFSCKSYRIVSFNQLCKIYYL